MSPSQSRSISPKILISYRRAETSAHAGRLSDQLSAYFGAQIIFIDTESIEPGRDFVEAIEDAVSSCKIVLAVIGQQWLTCANESGRRLDDPNDFVRLEIATALKRGVRVIPVLVQGATMPRKQDLPDELAPLAQKQAWTVRDSGWKEDVKKLIAKIEGDIIPEKGVSSKSSKSVTAFITLVCVVVLVLLVWAALEHVLPGNDPLDLVGRWDYTTTFREHKTNGPDGEPLEAVMGYNEIKRQGITGYEYKMWGERTHYRNVNSGITQQYKPPLRIEIEEVHYSEPKRLFTFHFVVIGDSEGNSRGDVVMYLANRIDTIRGGVINSKIEGTIRYLHHDNRWTFVGIIFEKNERLPFSYIY